MVLGVKVDRCHESEAVFDYCSVTTVYSTGKPEAGGFSAQTKPAVRYGSGAEFSWT